MIGKLDHLVATGITALELMPLADFAGQRNWGYDGVLWYAPDSAYGRPDDLKALIDEAHLRGLMVFLDVVYNHFGPEGNYLGRYAPSFFTDAQTPWGSAIDYRVPEVRAFAIENALYWLRELSLRRAAAGCRARHRRARRNLDAARSQPRGRRARRGNRPAYPSGARERRQPAQPARRRRRSAARQISRAMERRLSSRLARAADRREPRLLPRLSALAARTISPARSARALSIRARRPRIAAGNCAASRAASSRRPPSSISCRTTTRSATARSATGSKATPIRSAIEAALAITLLAPMRPDAVHGRGMGLESAVPVLLRFQGRSRRSRARRTPQGIRRRLCQIWRRDSRSAWNRRPFNPRCWIGRRSTRRRDANGWRWCDELLAIRQREIIPRLAGAAFGDAQAADNGLLTAALAHGRRRDAAAAGQPVEPGHPASRRQDRREP